jgi:tetratricopeptide (TPR) repeat protein
LIKVSDGYHLWSETYDRELIDVFAIQDEIAKHVVEALKITLLGEAPSVQETNPEAYALVLQARHLGRQETTESLERAETLYRKALDIAPEYAAAWAGLADIYAEQTGNGARTTDEGYLLARETANHALSIDPEQAPAHATLGLVSLLNNDPAGAAGHLQRALELDPSNPDIIREAATLVELLGRLDEAIDLLKFVAERDPVNAEGHSNLGRSYRTAGRWDEAVAAYQTSLALSPGRIGSQHGMGEALLLNGDPEAALAAYSIETDEEWRTKGTALALYTLGRQIEFESAFEKLRERWGEQWPSEVAHVYAWTGDADAAFDWLSKAVDLNEDGLYQQYYQPLLKTLHDDPRWAAFRDRTIGSEARLAEIEFEVKLP